MKADVPITSLSNYINKLRIFNQNYGRLFCESTHLFICYTVHHCDMLVIRLSFRIFAERKGRRGYKLCFFQITKWERYNSICWLLKRWDNSYSNLHLQSSDPLRKGMNSYHSTLSFIETKYSQMFCYCHVTVSEERMCSKFIDSSLPLIACNRPLLLVANIDPSF